MSRPTTPDTVTAANELEAFCPTCPPVEDVTAQLEQLGYRLVFSLPAQRAQDHLAPLPAQYHYRHTSGAEAIFLAGRDNPLHTGELGLPSHESRFWLFRGGCAASAFELALSALAARWRLEWQEARETRNAQGGDDEEHEDQEVA